MKYVSGKEKFLKKVCRTDFREKKNHENNVSYDQCMGKTFLLKLVLITQFQLTFNAAELYFMQNHLTYIKFCVNFIKFSILLCNRVCQKFA